jgi:hypothetical protein
MNKPSEEQRLIIDEIINGKNVIVDACAGSGKSTTILSCALELPHKKILQTTYNNQLRQEVKENIREFDLKNIEVYTYHCIGVKYYFPEAFDDNGIRKILREDMVPKIKLPSIDLLVLDECQDMTFLYFQFMVKFTKDMGNPLQLLILGDKMQGIYSFRGANSVFLTSAKELWEEHPLLISREFISCSLHTSYRITDTMADFVNQAMLGENRLIACKSGIPVYYIRRPIHQISMIVIYHIKKLISEKKCTYGDIFILAGSVKKDEIKKIENAFVETDIPCYIPMVDTQDRLDNRAIDKKVVFSTFHAVKGRQRKYVFVVGFDSTFYYKYDNELPKDKCPNTLYVACTRATDGLFLLENDSSHIRPLPFLQISHQDMKQKSFINFIGNAVTMAPIITDSENTETKEKVRYITPTSLIQFVSENTLDIISPLLDKIYHKIETESVELDIPSFIPTKNGFYEEISDLNGNAIPIMYCEHLSITSEHKNNISYKNVFQKMILELSKKFYMNKHLFLKNIINNMPETCETISDYLYLANILQATETKLYSKLKQIQPDEYNWIKEEVILKCFQQLDAVVGQDCKLNEWKPEHTILYSSADEDHFEIDLCLSEFLGHDYKYRFQARIDLLTDNTLWEFKCTSKISVEHMLQLVIYAWIWLNVYKTPKIFRLFNIKTNELWELKADKTELTQIVVELIRGKYNGENDKNKKTDEFYIAQARSLFL